MHYVRLGSSGLKVSRIMPGHDELRGRHGTGVAPGRGARPSRSSGQAAESGVTFFDTADMYSGGMTEEITGRLLGKLFGPSR